MAQDLRKGVARMIWTRRTFIQTILAGLAGAAIMPTLAPWFPPPGLTFIPFDPAQPFLIYELTACGVSDGITILSLTRNGQGVLRAGLHGRSYFRWVAAPGCELHGLGLRNESTADLEVAMCVAQENRRYFIDQGGCVTYFGTSRPHPTKAQLAAYRPRGSYAEYLRRESFVVRLRT
jgi:hypothetical protein